MGKEICGRGVGVGRARLDRRPRIRPFLPAPAPIALPRSIETPDTENVDRTRRVTRRIPAGLRLRARGAARGVRHVRGERRALRVPALRARTPGAPSRGIAAMRRGPRDEDGARGRRPDGPRVRPRQRASRQGALQHRQRRFLPPQSRRRGRANARARERLHRGPDDHRQRARSAGQDITQRGDLLRHAGRGGRLPVRGARAHSRTIRRPAPVIHVIHQPRFHWIHRR